MKKRVAFWQFAGFTVAVALGTILHFLFDWTGSFALAPVSAVNESTWEHMKILFFPMLLFAAVQSPFFRTEFLGFWWIKLIGILAGVLAVPVLFYTANGVFGKTPDWVNILFFFIAAGIGYLLEYHLFVNDFAPARSWVAVLLLIAVAVAFIAFTFNPPRLPIFQDPLTGG